MKIEKIHAREILDSRGNPTVEVEVTLDSRPSKRRHRIFHIDLRDELVLKI